MVAVAVANWCSVAYEMARELQITVMAFGVSDRMRLNFHMSFHLRSPNITIPISFLGHVILLFPPTLVRWPLWRRRHHNKLLRNGKVWD